MNYFLVDASALVKRYYCEAGAALVDHLFARVSRDRLACLMLGTAEVAAALARKRNGGLIPAAVYATAMANLRAEVLHVADFTKLPSDNALIDAAIPLLDKHAINSSDAIVLRTALNLAPQLRTAGDDLVLVASDQRLLRAAQAEGLVTFDPEMQTQTDLDALIVP
ncbi:MAG TPA: type II toxin-antitoxin system VapC family toxin [Gemmataceae bacterium]|nr:type II toxin-antitoxin system VapC family toxin [Gemmataceae bacterium]